MPPVTRITDIALGHDCYAPSKVIQCSPNVLAESLGIHRLRDAIMPHVCVSSSHSRQSSEASPNVLVNNLGACRVGDSVSCGGCLASGAITVMVN